MTMRGKLLCAALAMVAIGAAVKVARGHDIYGDWMMPDSPSVSCCHDQDCRPVRASQNGEGQWTAFVDGRKVLVPPDKLLKFPSPDGRSHWCGSGEVTYCFLPGDIRS